LEPSKQLIGSQHVKVRGSISFVVVGACTMPTSFLASPYISTHNEATLDSKLYTLYSSDPTTTHLGASAKRWLSPTGWEMKIVVGSLGSTKALDARPWASCIEGGGPAAGIAKENDNCFFALFIIC